MGLLPDQFLSLTCNELNALYEGKQQRLEWERENAAFSGYCAGLAFAMAWNGKLEGFSDFYQVPTPPDDVAQESEDYISRYRSWN